MTDSRFERNDRFERGLALRREVLGREHVERSLARAQDDPFLLPIQQIAVEFGWGEVWSRPGLPLKTRSFLSIAYLAAQGKLDELGAHVAGAVRNGASRDEIREVLLQAALYCGMPVGLEAFRVAKRALDDLDTEIETDEEPAGGEGS
ncbi:MAG: carboxymuconolactone decarboxylase family protein [Immundisolibacterales bacterium]|nr:carboxymuconolactone decarboxylase family protein [Immundisolibacterales bacterium]